MCDACTPAPPSSSVVDVHAGDVAAPSAARSRTRTRRRSSPRGRRGRAAAPGPTPPARRRPSATGTTPEHSVMAPAARPHENVAAQARGRRRRRSMRSTRRSGRRASSAWRAASRSVSPSSGVERASPDGRIAAGEDHVAVAETRCAGASTAPGVPGTGSRGSPRSRTHRLSATALVGLHHAADHLARAREPAPTACPVCRRTSPTERPVSPSTATIFQSPVSQRGAADAGSTAAPNPSKASDATSRMPSTSALVRSVTPRSRGLRVEVVAERGARRLEQQVVLGELGERDAVALGERMVAGRDDEEVLVEEVLGFDVGIVDRAARARRGRAARCGPGGAARWWWRRRRPPAPSDSAPPSPRAAGARASGRSCRSRRCGRRPRPRRARRRHRRPGPRARAGRGWRGARPPRPPR